MRPPLIREAPMLTKINVTPIIDVALVLVIILLITAPMLAVADIKVELPGAVTRDIEEQSYVSVTLGKNGEVAVEDQMIDSLDQVAAVLGSRLAEIGRQESLVVVRADAELPHEFVRLVIEQVRAGGAQRLAIATRQLGGE
jgi:biopolymer transport protein TolR